MVAVIVPITGMEGVYPASQVRPTWPEGKAPKELGLQSPRGLAQHQRHQRCRSGHIRGPHNRAISEGCGETGTQHGAHSNMGQQSTRQAVVPGGAGCAEGHAMSVH